MDYYMLKMTWTDDNGEASLDHDELRKFISQTHLIGLGSPRKGAYVFEHQIRKGDIVIVLGKRWAPQVIVKVLDDNAEEYHPDTSLYPLLGWIEHVRNVEILAWCHAPDPHLNLPPFNTNWSRNTCCHIDDTTQQETIKKWIETVMNNNNVNDCTEMLRKVKNLILTGAPGTGKTYLAKQIAYAITGDTEDTPEDERHWAFVQFHPSYDYTDFVEGLRPTPPRGTSVVSSADNNNIGFERQDGVFKEFCKKAAQIRVDDSKDEFKEAFDEAFRFLINYLEENGYADINYLSDSGSVDLTPHTFRIESYPNKKGVYAFPSEISTIYINSDQLYRVYRGLPGVESGAHNNYRKAIINWMKDKAHLREFIQPSRVIKSSNDQNYVFIIDEINRGDIAKIFGELFFAIDPDYRGPKGKIPTQYTNLIKDYDLFKDGFYVPENVYIIGTMNDIDRNVECMDFAIRRRFTWVEIEPKDTISMWNDPEKGIPEYRDKAQKCMDSINKAIKDTPGLGPAYQLGAAYFLKLRNYGGDFELLWKNHIRPLLKEYLRGMPNADETLSGMEQIWKENTPSNPTESVAIPAEVQAETEQQAETIESAPSSADTEQQ